MLIVRHIDSLEDPDLRPYRTMRRQMEQRERGIFVAEGEKVVRRLLESELTVISVLLPPKWLDELQTIIEKRPERIQVYVADKALLETLTGFSLYQGLLAIGTVPPQPRLKDVLAKAPRPRLLVALDGLSSAENVGSVVRNCAAFHVQGLITGETSTSPFLRRAVRSSMGTVFNLPVIETADLLTTILELKVQGIRCIAAHPHITGRTIDAVNLAADSCIIFGSEGYGLAPAILAACDEAAAIPMPRGVDSLNVSSAAAVFLYEARRQRATNGSGTR
jgi:tRNA G18 (ribose-2'-O)-methylase SpoU